VGTTIAPAIASAAIGSASALPAARVRRDVLDPGR
jgi:hypothetical protein